MVHEAAHPPLCSQENLVRHDRACTYAYTHAALAGNTTIRPPSTRLDADDETALHIVRPPGETLHNATKHARAARTTKETYIRRD